MFRSISNDSEFKVANFYTFAYDFNMTCVAHGLNEAWVGLNLTQVFDQVGIELNATELHDKFVKAARQGGGWVAYQWLDPKSGVRFEKITFIFPFVDWTDGRNPTPRQFYGGVGFNHKRLPTKEFMAAGRKKNKHQIPCSANYDSPCSETNSRGILGQTLAEATLAASGARDPAGTPASHLPSMNDKALREVFYQVSHRNETFRVNDFHTLIFSLDESSCTDKGSGCCKAHGDNPKPSMVGKSWNQILKQQGITSIEGGTLHKLLVQASNTGGSGVVEYMWYGGSDGEISGHKKLAHVASFQRGAERFYVVSEYLLAKPPPTCDACPDDMHCTHNDQSFCVPKPEPSTMRDPKVVSLIFVSTVVGLSAALFFWKQKQYVKRISRAKLQMLQKELDDLYNGVVKVVRDITPISKAEYETERIHLLQRRQKAAPFWDEAVVWCYEEHSGVLGRHKPSFILPGTCLVRSSEEVSTELEEGFSLFQQDSTRFEKRIDVQGKIQSTHSGEKGANPETGTTYIVDFARMEQRNENTGKTRRVYRMCQSDFISGAPPPIPRDILASTEDLLPVISGQLVQISKRHKGGLWLFGKILDDSPQDDSLQDVSTHLDRPASGWFPVSVSEPADIGDVKKRLARVPPGWHEGVEGRVELSVSDKEFQDALNYFEKSFDDKAGVTVERIERIQNTALFQQYAIKKEAMITRNRASPHLVVHNGNIEPHRWLFHGTSADVVDRICADGFNRSFAGKNAVLYGSGVYFARHAKFSSNVKYAEKDSRGMQYMFLARVAVGDICKGRNGQLVPDPKPHCRQGLPLFDSTVNNVEEPTIFVIYHDSQAYPEYLISFNKA